MLIKINLATTEMAVRRWTSCVMTSAMLTIKTIIFLWELIS